MIVIDLIPSTDHVRDSYGIILRSKFSHRITGPGVHNPSHQHLLQVWLNANGHDPMGRPTDHDLAYLWSAQALVITSNPRGHETVFGPALALGDTVALRIGQREIGKFLLINSPLHDPHLERI